MEVKADQAKRCIGTVDGLWSDRDLEFLQLFLQQLVNINIINMKKLIW